MEKAGIEKPKRTLEERLAAMAKGREAAKLRRAQEAATAEASGNVEKLVPKKNHRKEAAERRKEHNHRVKDAVNNEGIASLDIAANDPDSRTEIAERVGGDRVVIRDATPEEIRAQEEATERAQKRFENAAKTYQEELADPNLDQNQVAADKIVKGWKDNDSIDFKDIKPEFVDPERDMPSADIIPLATGEKAAEIEQRMARNGTPKDMFSHFWRRIFGHE